METAGAIQETYNTWSWLLPLISGAIGTLIDTYGGFCFLHWKQEKKVKNVRSMAVKALDILKEYAQQKRTYADTADEFNTRLSISEKRAIVVALHKLGVPFETPTRDAFDIRGIRFKDIVIDKDEIITMIVQINRGNCDDHFFADIESYFTSNLRLSTVRNVSKRYVEEVHAESRTEREKPDTIASPINWHKQFTSGELQTILILGTQLADTGYFSRNERADSNKIKDLVGEIEIELWDNYLFYDYEFFINIQTQHNLASVVQSMIMMDQQQVNTQNTQAEVSESK